MDGELGELIMDAADVIVRIAIVAAAGFVIPWLRARRTSEQLGQMERVALDVVRATEQFGKQNGWDAREKLDSALTSLDAWLETKIGFSVDDKRKRELIESAVNQMNDSRMELLEIEQ